jgi:dienelactone hydrolase
VQDRLSELKSVTQSLKQSGYVNISLYGFCWGGKISAVASQHADLFKSVAIVHPAMLDAKDVEDLRVPFGFYPSKVCELYVSAAAYSNISRAYVYTPLTERA